LLPHPIEVYADEHPPGTAVKGTVAAVVRAGVFVDLADGVRGFVPRNELGWGGAEGGELVAEGDEIEAAVVGLDTERRRLKLSIKKLQPHPFDAFRQANAVGDEVIGRVGDVTDIGAYVSLGGGLDGLVHVSEIAWRRVERPSDVLSVGEELKVQVVAIDEKRRRVGLSIKATQPDPFEAFTSSNKPGSRVQGKVLRLSDKSAFVELKDGIEGFIPVSELSWKRVGLPADVLRVGEIVKAEVLNSDPKRRQVKLSVKQLQPDPFDSIVKRAQAGEAMTGTVVSLADFGAFVELDEGAQGLIHISKLSTAFVSHPSQVVTPGQRVVAHVLSIDHSKRKISLVYAGPAA
jgi:small subunit ribosomal protein S1